jgi:thioredoxin reductase
VTSYPITELRTDVLIVGAGPAGLTAAAELKRAGAGDVLVLERENMAGGIPRHSDHLGYGLRDLRRVLSGPEYARRLAAGATSAGAVVRTEAMVTSWTPAGAALVTTPQGRLEVTARAVVLTTGARERARAARLVPGDRPHGVYTTGQLQNLVHLQHGVPGQRAVVVGAELVSWSAVLTLREAGCRTVLMTSALPTAESYAALSLGGRLLARTELATSTRVVRVIGRHGVDGGGVEALEVEHIPSGRRRTVACDTVVFTGDWIPDHELARSAGLEIDRGTNGPAVDTVLRTTRPGVFAAGNLVHPVDTADVAALDGRHVAAGVRRWLDRPSAPTPAVRVLVESPLRWVSPNLVRVDDPPPARRRLLLWADELVRRPTVLVRQQDRTVARRRLPWPAAPGRVFRVPSSVLDDIDPTAGDVTIGLARPE